MPEKWIAEVGEPPPRHADALRQHAPAQAADEAPAQRPQTQVAGLGDLINDGLTLFTPALLLTHGGFDRDPVVEFVRTVRTSDAQSLPFVIDSEFSYFDGLGLSLLHGRLVNWGSRLYAAEPEVWPELRDFVCALAWTDARRYDFARTFAYELQMIDPHALHGRVLSELPSVPVTIFGVSAYRGRHLIKPAGDPPRTRPYAETQPPDPAHVAATERLLGVSARPIVTAAQTHNDNKPL